MAEQYARALTSVAYAARFGEGQAGIEPEPIVIGAKRGVSPDSEAQAQVWGALSLSAALEELALSEEAVALPRAVVLDQLVRLAVSPGRDRLTDEEYDLRPQLRNVLGSVGRVGGVIEEERTENALEALLALAQSDVVGADAWDFFVAAAGDSLALTATERNKPLCRDAPMGGDDDPVEVTVEFWTDRKVQQLARYADPREWPACSAYFSGMVPQGESLPLSSPAGTDFCGWEQVLVERLAVFPPYNFVTPLCFTSYWAPDRSYVRTAYRLEHETTDIAVDAGFIEVATGANPPDPGRPTRVTATKVIQFKHDDLQAWPTLACDTFWIEMAIQMAHNCACSGAAAPAQP